MKLKPDIVADELIEISLDQLKQRNIRCLLVDIDNTLAAIDQSNIKQKNIDWLANASKHMRIILISNNHGQRIKAIEKMLGYPTYSFALKPFSRVYFKIKKQYQYKAHEVAVIGDQWLTDILGGKLHRFMTIYVEPISKKDTIFTTFTRTFERIITRQWKK